MQSHMVVAVRYMIIAVVIYAGVDYALSRFSVAQAVRAYVGIGLVAILSLMIAAAAYREGRRSMRRSDD